MDDERIDARRLLEALDEYLALLSEYLSKLRRLYEERGEELRILTRPEELARLAERLSDEEAGRLFKALVALSAIASTLSTLGSLEPDDIERLRGEVEKARRIISSELSAQRRASQHS